MTRSAILILFTLISFTTYSQDLRPDKVIEVNQDTLFCWGQVKCHELAKCLISLSYYENLNELNQTEILEADSIISLQDSTITDLKKEVANDSLIVDLKDKAIQQKEVQITGLKADIRKQKVFKCVGYGLAFIAIVFGAFH